MSAQSPRPTAHEPKSGCTLNRRDFAKAIGMAASIGAGGAASSETATAQTGSLLYSPMSPTVTGLIAAKGIAEWASSVDGNPTADEVQLHSMAVSEWESYKAHDQTFNNHLSDTAPSASLEARKEIANSWEDGLSVTEAYSNAQQAIRAYYATFESNHLEVLNKALTQFSTITNTALNDDNIFDDFVGVLVPTYYDMSDDTEVTVTHVKNIVSPERTPVTYTLTDGSDHEISIELEEDEKSGVPILKFETDEYGVLSTPFDQSVIDSYDTDAEQFNIEFPDAGTNGLRLETSLSLDVMNVGEELQGQTVMDFRTWYDLYDKVISQSDTVTANYSESFVQSLFDELDAGNITPSQIRGAEGQAKFLSGTDDPSSDRFKMALLQQLNMEQPDLSRTASMSIDYSGYTGTEVKVNDSGGRSFYTTGNVSDKTYNGLMFSRSAPAGGYQTGNSYAANPTLWWARDGFASMGAADDNSLWSALESTTIEHVMPVPSSDLVVAQEFSNSTVYGYSTSNGTEQWTYSPGDAGRSMKLTADGSTILGAVGTAGAYSINADGSENWNVNPWSSAAAAIGENPDTGAIYVGTQDPTLDELDPADGSVVQSYTPASNVQSLTATADAIYVGLDNGTIVALDPADLSEMWTANPNSTTSSINELYAAGDYLLVRVRYSSVCSIDLTSENQDTLWFKTPTAVDSVALDPSGTEAFVAGADGNGTYVSYDMASGSTIRTGTGPSDSANRIEIADPSAPGTTPDGLSGSALMYDSGSGDEIEFHNGMLTITSMTDREGNEVEDGYQPGNEPKYNSYDSTEYVAYTEKAETYKEQLEEEETSGPGPIFGGGNLFEGGGGLLGLGIIGIVILAVIGIVTDAIPGLGN